MPDALLLPPDADELLRWLVWGLAALAWGVLYALAHRAGVKR